MSNEWHRGDMPEYRGLLNALTDNDPDVALIEEHMGLTRVLDAVVRKLNEDFIKFPKSDMRRPLVVQPPSLAEIAQEQRDRAERAEGACAQLRELLRELEDRKSVSRTDVERQRAELEAANEQLHREWTAVFIRATHAEAERDELRAVMCAEKDQLVRVETKENQA